MPVASSRRLSATPYFPGSWPGPSHDQHDHDSQAQDADVSSVSSYGSVIPHVRVRKVSSRKARRRWTYAGHAQARSRSWSSDPPSHIYATQPLVGANVDHDSRINLSPLTEATISTAMSSPLNTPDLADWPTRLDVHSASQSLLLDNIPCPNMSPSSVTRLNPDSLPHQGSSRCRTRLQSSASRDNRFPSPHLDPPLLNFIPGLPPLRLPLSDLFVDLPYEEGPPRPPSPPETCSTPSSFDIPSPRQGYPLPPTDLHATLTLSSMASNFFPVAETPEPSPHMTVSSVTESQASHTDSPVLPPISIGITPGLDYMHLAPPISDMDAFALAAAVASSNSRSSFSIPPSIHSTAALHTTALNGPSSEHPRSHVSQPHSCTTAASAGHHSRPVSSYREGTNSAKPPIHSLDHRERSRARRLSAPPPALRHSPRPQLSRTISSRVDVGRTTLADRRDKLPKQPVLGKVRKFGERIRGLFKSKGETPPKTNPGHTGSPPEYGMMTTTTAVTNVEYESEHPIPLPSPRARIMRNHRRSLPIQSLLPSSLERVHSTILKRAAPGHDGVSQPPSPLPHQPSIHLTPSEEVQDTLIHDPCQSPHTPKPRRERTQTAPQTAESERKALNERKARRFSLSSALTKSKIDSLRSTVKPRPPLPKHASRTRDDATGGSSARGAELGAVPSTVEHPDEVVTPSMISPEGEPFWGGELPNLPSTRDTGVAASVVDLSTCSKAQTAQTPHSTVPSTPKDKRSRRFSLSSLMVKRSTRPPEPSGQVADCSSPAGAKKTKLSRRRLRGDTITATTRTSGAVRSEKEKPKPAQDVPPVPSSNRSSMASSSAESTYYDAREQLSEPGHDFGFFPGRSCSPRPESDLDSMSFARTPDYSSGTFSFGSSTEREYYHELSETSISGSRDSTRIGTGTRTMTMSHLVGESQETPITKTLRFSPSLSLSFDMSCSDFGDEDALHRLEREEDLSFMRALGFEFDEIARRVREESL